MVSGFLGVFIARGKEDALVTKNIVPGETVYGEKKNICGCRCKVVIFVLHFVFV